jgi:hypothetical protein
MMTETRENLLRIALAIERLHSMLNSFHIAMDDLVINSARLATAMETIAAIVKAKAEENNGGDSKIE